MKNKLLYAILLALISFTQTINAQAPTVTGFAPVIGPVGTSITITGTNFNATPTNNTVFFGATLATVSAATATQLSVIVPNGATHDYITVLNTTTGLSTYTLNKFTPTYTPNTGTITASDFGSGISFPTGAYPTLQDKGDFDGDGKTDLVVVNDTGNSISVLRNISAIGSISFAPNVNFAAGTEILDMAIGDLDGDGKLDVAIANGVNNTVSIFRNSSNVGSISFEQKIDLATPSPGYAMSIAISDLDGDGKLDIVVGSLGSFISVLMNTSTVGTISYAPYVSFSVGERPTSIAIGDLDNDGKTDLVVTNRLGNSISVLRNTSTIGSFGFVPGGTFTATTYPVDVAISDLDGDGKLDLAVASSSLSGIAILRNTSSAEGEISFDDVIKIPAYVNQLSIAIGDIDGDGKPDIAVEDLGYRDILIFKNTSTLGAISYAEKVTIDFNVNPTHISIADLDGDGRPDLSYTLSGVDVVGILKNNPVSLGISDFDDSSNFTLYPNPANNTIVIKSNGNKGNTHTEIIDISGRVLQSIKSDFENEVSIDVSLLSSGNYFLKLQSENGSAIKKFIKI